MLWLVDTTAELDLHRQVAACVRRGVASGELAAGERLPTARELAESLGINHNTVLRAYRTLRDEGVLDFRRGRGVVVLGGAARRSAQENQARELLLQAQSLGLSRDDLVRLLDDAAVRD